MNEWVQSLLKLTPTRCQPSMYMDLNSKVGMSKDVMGEHPHDSPAVGTQNLGVESSHRENGERVG
eukprot:10151108-Karenia_brevis.AAC.1